MKNETLTGESWWGFSFGFVAGSPPRRGGVARSIGAGHYLCEFLCENVISICFY